MYVVAGSIMKSVQVDETDEERREMERLVAKANADRKNKKKGKKHEKIDGTAKKSEIKA